MKILLNKDNKLVFVQGDTKCKLIEILSKYRSREVKLTNIVLELYNSYDDSKRIYTLRLVDSFVNEGLVVKKKISGDVYIVPVFKEATILYYTPLIILYFPLLSTCILIFSLCYKNYLVIYFAALFAVFTNILLIVVYVIERFILLSARSFNIVQKLKQFLRRN